MSAVIAARKSALFPLCLLTALACFSGAVHADAAAFRQPIHGMGGQLTYNETRGGNLDVNPERKAVVSDRGHETVGSIKLDQSDGTIRGYASYKLAQDIVVPRPRDPGLVAVDGKLFYTAHVLKVGDGPTPDEPLKMQVELTVHGSFEEIIGHPLLALAGSLAVNHFPGGMASGVNDVYFVNLAFSTMSDTGWSETVDVKMFKSLTGASSQNPSYTDAIWAAGTAVQSARHDNLSAVLRLSVPVTEGDDVVLIGLLGATATHAYTVMPETVPIAKDIAVSAAQGAVDFSNTARLRIYMPQGLALSGPRAPAPGLVVTSAVPEPAAGLMAAAGLVLAWRGARRRGVSLA
ncbi:MAG: MYXO-CTERM sorting domain-containing protein [Aquabacterium sp.]